MNLYLRKVIHPQAHDNYRVILKLDEGEFEIGSICIQHALDSVAQTQRTSVPATFRHMA